MELPGLDDGNEWDKYMPLVEGDFYWTKIGLKRIRTELGSRGWQEAERIVTPAVQPIARSF